MPRCIHMRLTGECEVCELQARVEVLEDERDGACEAVRVMGVNFDAVEARVAELEARLSRRDERIRDLQKCQDRLRELDKVAQIGEGGSDA